MNHSKFAPNMKLLPNTRVTRNIAVVVLLALLFALAAGVANACLLEARGTHSDAAKAGYSEKVHAPVALLGHAGTVAGHDDDSHTSKAPCLKVCDEGSHTLPTQDVAVAGADPGPAPLVAVLWTAATPVVSATHRMDYMQPATPVLPIRVRYSRLAL